MSGLHLEECPPKERMLMNDDIVTLLAVNITYYSQYDEDVFFNWLKKIKCVVNFDGEGEILRFEVNKTKLNDRWLREILALFFRYEIEMTQLKVFIHKNNSSWFCDPEKYWYTSVFK